MRTQPQSGLLDAIRVDISRLHGGWMEFVFPNQLNPSPVAGKWKPDSSIGIAGYYAWAILGIPLLLIMYPVLLSGFALRFYARRLDSAAARLGVLGTVGVSSILWGGLTVFARYQFSMNGFVAVFAASIVATVSAVLAVITSRTGGRVRSIAFAYPFGVTALFLPPVVAALYSPTLATWVFPGSTTVAIWILDNLLTVGGLNSIIRAQFELTGVSYVGMWIGLSAPIGWVLGGVVAFSEIIRPSN